MKNCPQITIPMHLVEVGGILRANSPFFSVFGRVAAWKTFSFIAVVSLNFFDYL